MTEPLDLLAIMAHPDDAELLCGGALAKAAALGDRVGILDLTRGEVGSSGSGKIRAEEAVRSAKLLGLAVRRNAGLPDSGLINDDASRSIVVGLIRELRPSVIQQEIVSFPIRFLDCKPVVRCCLPTLAQVDFLLDLIAVRRWNWVRRRIVVVRIRLTFVVLGAEIS